MAGDGAHNRTRTDDLFLTKEVLCQLSYVGPDPIARRDVEVVGREGFEPPCLSDLVYSQASRRCSTDPLWRRAGSRLRARGGSGHRMDVRWSRRRDSNPKPAVYKTAALPIELRRRDGQGHTAEDPIRRREMIGPPAVMGQA